MTIVHKLECSNSKILDSNKLTQWLIQDRLMWAANVSFVNKHSDLIIIMHCELDLKVVGRFKSE